jgi:acetyltransferase-like isoleucine patch superfamily enzyme
MRQIAPKAISIFSTLTILNIFLNTELCVFLFQKFNTPHLVLYFVMPVTFYLTTILTYRLLFYYLKFPSGQIPKNTFEDFAFQMYVLYYLIYFNFFIHNPLLPVPISRGFHQLLGAKYGAGSYSGGIIMDPPYVVIGENTIIGFSAVLCSHAMEGESLSYDTIFIGNNVTVGLRSIIMPGVIIEDNAIIAAGALVTKNTHIKSGEVWAGIPAKRIKFGKEGLIPSIVNVAS